MTVKDQIPSFPELVGFYRVKCEVAFGTTDERHWHYHSCAERDYALDLATEKILGLIRQGHIRTTGRKREIKRGPLRRWQAQQYKQHSNCEPISIQIFGTQPQL
jgi:hypothetical protein